MPVPQSLRGKLVAPVIGAPMFLVSFPPLVAALCTAGVVGTFPHVNARPAEQFEQWLLQLEGELDRYRAANPRAVVAPFGVNLVVHRTNARFQPDLEVVVRHRVPLVLTSLGHPGPVVEAVHAYGGLVFSDVTNAAHARKAAQAGVDGLICVGAGAGGHASTQSAFSLVGEIREFWDGCLVLGGGINDGRQVRAAEALGADFAYIGTRFIASRESQASEEYKRMLVDSGVDDLVYTDRLSGIGCNFLKPSLEQHGVDLAALPPKSPDLGALLGGGTKVWRDLWSAGQGVATIHDVPPAGEIVARIAREYRQACAMGPSAALAGG